MIGRLLGLFSNERLAKDISEVTRVIVILKKKTEQIHIAEICSISFKRVLDKMLVNYIFSQ